MTYQNKGVVVTGAASGIGFESALAFADAGASVVLVDIEPAALEKAAADIKAKTGATVFSQRCDVSNQTDVERLAEEAFSRLGRVDVLFHNAGVGIAGPITEMTDKDWRWVLDVNLWGSIYMVQAFVPQMKGQGNGGSIVFTSSFAGLVPSAGMGPYCVSKTGVISLAEVLRQELRSDGIGVSVLCPMRVSTNIGSSGRNRNDEIGRAGASPEITDPSDDSLAGSVIEASDVAQQVLEGIANNDAFIMTHAEGRKFVERRAAKIASAFDRRE